jgi:hypothetical protein
LIEGPPAINSITVTSPLGIAGLGGIIVFTTHENSNSNPNVTNGMNRFAYSV